MTTQIIDSKSKNRQAELNTKESTQQKVLT